MQETLGKEGMSRVRGLLSCSCVCVCSPDDDQEREQEEREREKRRRAREHRARRESETRARREMQMHRSEARGGQCGERGLELLHNTYLNITLREGTHAVCDVIRVDVRNGHVVGDLDAGYPVLRAARARERRLDLPDARRPRAGRAADGERHARRRRVEVVGQAGEDGWRGRQGEGDRVGRPPRAALLRARRHLRRAHTRSRRGRHRAQERKGSPLAGPKALLGAEPDAQERPLWRR